MSNERNRLAVKKVDDVTAATASLDVIVLAAGFEDRAFELIAKGRFSSHARCVLIRYNNAIPENVAAFERFQSEVSKKFSQDSIYILDLSTRLVAKFEEEIRTLFSTFPPDLRRIAIDVSGMTSYLICIALKYAREFRPYEKQTVFYTSAVNYTPDKKQYQELVSKLGEDIEYLPPAMALEMSENLVLDSFGGHQSGQGKTCLIVFAGYEVHRSTGTIEATNPSSLLLFYGDPEDSRLKWRLEFSKRLHAKFEKSRRCGTETVSTLQPQQSLDLLEQYYEYLIDDFDVIISPICSKMHTVATFLFWERYGEVQLSFPLPIGYLLVRSVGA